MRSFAVIALIVALVLVAAGAGFLAGKGPGEPDGEAQALLRRVAHQLDHPVIAQAAAVREDCPSAPAPSLDEQALRRILCEEMEPEAAAAPPPAPRGEPAPEVLQARADGRALVDGALAAGRWTAEDRDALRRLLPKLDETGTKELFARLVPAVNAQQVRVDVAGPFF